MVPLCALEFAIVLIVENIMALYFMLLLFIKRTRLPLRGKPASTKADTFVLPVGHRSLLKQVTRLRCIWDLWMNQISFSQPMSFGQTGGKHGCHHFPKPLSTKAIVKGCWLLLGSSLFTKKCSNSLFCPRGAAQRVCLLLEHAVDDPPKQ